MEENNNIVECQVTAGPLAPVVNPIEEFKLKIKAILDESTVLSRRVNEVAWQQKQKKNVISYNPAVPLNVSGWRFRNQTDFAF